MTEADPQALPLNRAEKRRRAKAPATVARRPAVEVPLELLDQRSLDGITGFCKGKDLVGEYVLTLVPKDAPPA